MIPITYRNIILKIAIFITLTFTLSSCAKKVDIYYPTQFVKDNKVIINGNINLLDHVQNNEYSVVSVHIGGVDISINGEESEIQTYNGGLLNLNEEEFVVFTILYGDIHRSPYISRFSVVLDSVFYYETRFGYDESTLDRYREYSYSAYNKKHTEIFGYAVINKTDFFAEKSWDLDMYDEIPNKMKIRVMEGSGQPVGGQRVIKPSNIFKLLAALSDEYSSIDLRK